jgi:hypothetical protein
MDKKTITPYLLEGFLLIALNLDWIEAFDGIPSFDVTVGTDDKLHIVSSKKIKHTTTKRETERD